jgi:hypothetical protein
MDLLLRGLARRQGTRSDASEDHSAKHLDADELNSYAEQALPAAARARYTSHLADCERCRKIASELTSASGASVSEHQVALETSSLRQKLATFFSPRVLRYAAPAFALLAFMVVGLIAIRQQTKPELIAANEPIAGDHQSDSATNQVGSPAESQQSTANSSNNEGFYDSPTRAGTGKDNLGKDNLARSNEKSDTSRTTTPTDSLSGAADRDASPGKTAGAVEQPKYAPEPAAPPPPNPQSPEVETRTEVAARQKKEVDKNENKVARDEETRARTDDSQNQGARPQMARSSPTVQSELQTADAKRMSGAGAKAKSVEADTRTVSGRVFRRQGGAWIDTAFQSSSATTILSRGSEQFRALVADEPGIRAIASQLSGEIVVVWKGRAYRIR